VVAGLDLFGASCGPEQTGCSMQPVGIRFSGIRSVESVSIGFTLIRCQKVLERNFVFWRYPAN
ncbi:MAG: hypothetical protein ABSA42_20200, partial [Terracidiphilus sp.]